MNTSTLSPNHVASRKADRQLLLDPSALIGLLERERDALTHENKALRAGLDRLIESASASADMVLPLIAEDVIRCTQELSVAKGQLAMAITGGCAEDAMTGLVRRKESYERELEIARELQAEARRIAPLLDELRLLSGIPYRATPTNHDPVSCDVARAEQYFGIPISRSMPESKFDGATLAAMRSGLIGKDQPLRKPTITRPVAAPAPTAEKVAVPVETPHLRAETKIAQPSSTRPSGFGASLFGKLIGR